MEAPRYTVIVPMRRFRAEEPVLESLRGNAPTSTALEIFVTEGSHPARQRNAALELARGDIIVFLDNDCSLAPDFWSELERAFERPEVEIVGGPALLRPQATALEAIFHALLTHPLVVGPVSARYVARGEFRPATQTELILCNMAARRSLFTRIGPLSTRLYPNEENEWLERAQVAGTGIYYDPKLQIFRPHRATWGAMAQMLLRYGIGRTRQFWVSGWRLTMYQFLPLILLVPLVAFTQGPQGMEAFAVLWLLISLAVALTCDRRLRIWQRIVAGLAAPLVPLAYALGQLVGYPALLVPKPKADVMITLLNERGQTIPR
jgi:glycosyltransferase involved in cell wall biosynthesis